MSQRGAVQCPIGRHRRADICAGAADERFHPIKKYMPLQTASMNRPPTSDRAKEGFSGKPSKKKDLREPGGLPGCLKFRIWVLSLQRAHQR